ncbi:MAG: glutamyl-tRNA reductase [Rubrobacter sp.]|nr:glutamyl-tRNA reductase [Rubrobacter sp.]
MFIAALGMSHRSAPVEAREKVAFPPCQGRIFIRHLSEEENVSEAVLLSTCNRTEIYAVVEDERAKGAMLDLLAEDRGVERAEIEADMYWLTDSEAVAHLYRVASSLDSMVVGEAQVLGQVREAYRAATEEQCTGPVLNRLFHTSLRVGKQIRSETGIGDSSLSVPRVAAKLAEDVFGDLTGRRALVVGAGEMSELVIESLKERGVSEVKIANRTRERAESLAERVGGEVVGFHSIGEELHGVDVVVSSTGSGDWVIRNEDVSGAMERRDEPLFLIDIAVPRDIDPVVQTLDKAYLYDIDDLQAVVERNAGDREEAAEAAEAMIRPAVEGFMGWISTLHVVPLIRELRDEAEKIRTHELSRTVGKLDLSPEEELAIEKMSQALVNKLLHGPISEIKSRAEAGEPLDTIEIRRKLLALDGIGVELARSDAESR